MSVSSYSYYNHSIAVGESPLLRRPTVFCAPPPDNTFVSHGRNWDAISSERFPWSSQAAEASLELTQTVSVSQSTQQKLDILKGRGNLAQRSILARILEYDDVNNGGTGDVSVVAMSEAHEAEIQATVADVLKYFTSFGLTGALFCTMAWPRNAYNIMLILSSDAIGRRGRCDASRERRVVPDGRDIVYYYYFCDVFYHHRSHVSGLVCACLAGDDSDCGQAVVYLTLRRTHWLLFTTVHV